MIIGCFAGDHRGQSLMRLKREMVQPLTSWLVIIVASARVDVVGNVMLVVLLLQSAVVVVVVTRQLTYQYEGHQDLDHQDLDHQDHQGHQFQDPPHHPIQSQVRQYQDPHGQLVPLLHLPFRHLLFHIHRLPFISHHLLFHIHHLTMEIFLLRHFLLTHHNHLIIIGRGILALLVLPILPRTMAEVVLCMVY